MVRNLYLTRDYGELINSIRSRCMSKVIKKISNYYSYRGFDSNFPFRIRKDSIFKFVFNTQRNSYYLRRLDELCVQKTRKYKFTFNHVESSVNVLIKSKTFTCSTCVLNRISGTKRDIFIKTLFSAVVYLSVFRIRLLGTGRTLNNKLK